MKRQSKGCLFSLEGAMNDLIRGVAYCFLVLPNILVMTASQAIAGFGLWGYLFFAVFYAAVLFLVVLVHEGGHAVAVRLIGWRVVFFAVFPVAYRVKSKKLQFWISPSGDLGGAVGFSTDGKTRTRLRSIMLSAAGPLANFLLTGIAIGIISLWPLAQNVFGSIAVTSFFVGLGNLLPWRSKSGAKSDGAAILALIMAQKRASA
jgi:hypothetical protein